jgi:hypothetical protein
VIDPLLKALAPPCRKWLSCDIFDDTDRIKVRQNTRHTENRNGIHFNVGNFEGKFSKSIF